jgi:inorganic pyrophosphatase
MFRQPVGHPRRWCAPFSTNLLLNMSLDNVTPGKNVPESFNVIIEIPMNADPIKYEVDKETGAIFVDRFMSTAMHYPTNYGYVPKTISGDGDPVDVLVITPVPLIPGVVVPCRALGILKMQDEAGEDGKVLAVPIDKVLSIYTQWQKPEDLNPMRLNTIQHFFEHYKDLEPGKWVKVMGWEGKDAAHQEILDGIANYERAQKA